jgi:hypothetical protein
VIVAAERTGAGEATAARIVLTGTGVINFNTGSNNEVIEFEVLGTGLHLFETYTLIVATSAGGFSRNSGSPLPSGHEYAAADYRLLLPNYPDVSGVRLFLLDANTLALQFTPIPEPAGVLGCVAAAAAGWAARRRGRRSV